MATKDFIIKLRAEDERDLDTVRVREELIRLVRFTGAWWIEDIRTVPLVGVKLTGKIAAIKYIRSLLATSLDDSKAMVDAATALGTFKMHGLVIDYSDGLFVDVYTITDTR